MPTSESEVTAGCPAWPGALPRYYKCLLSFSFLNSFQAKYHYPSSANEIDSRASVSVVCIQDLNQSLFDFRACVLDWISHCVLFYIAFQSS